MMDRRSWPWKKKSSDKSLAATALSDSTTLHADFAGSQIDQEKKEEVRKPKYVQISVDTYSHLTGLEDQVKSYDEQVKTLEEEIKELNEKLTESHTEMTNKDNLVKQHAKVAEEAVSGWEKAEAEAAALKNHLESVTLLKLTAEDRASHLDGALKECMRQIRNLKEEHELKLHEVMVNNTKQFENVKFEFESKIAYLDQELMRSAAENAALSRSLQDRSSMLIKLSEEKSQAEAQIELLKSNIESCHKEINSLKYELHIATKEMEIRNEERNMSVRSAEVANKQHLEGVKKIAKLEAECQRLRGLVRKKLPGPAALAQMKLEVENLGRDHGDNRFRRSTLKPSASHLSSLPDISFEAVQKFHKENELLTERFLAMEEETKMLKEALAVRNSELQASRSICAKTASKLQSLEVQLRATGGHRSPSSSKLLMPIDGSMSQNVTSPPSVTSMSEDPNDDNVSCDGSWGTGLISDLSHSNKEQSSTIHKSDSANHLELMDDFLEMEKLAYASSDVNVAVSGVHASNTERPEIVNNTTPVNVTHGEDSVSKELIGSDFPATHGPLEREVSGANPVVNFQSRLRVVLESLSDETNIHKALEALKQVLQGAYENLHQQSADLVVEDIHSCKAPSDCENDAELTTEKVVISSLDSEPYSEAALSLSQELSPAIAQIHDFVMVLGKGIKDVQGTCSDSEDLSRSLEAFSSMYKEVENIKASLSQFVIDLSQVLHKANGFHCNFLGYKISDTENANSDCIDKVVLPENKGLKDTSGDRYPSVEFSDSNSDPDIPHEGSPVPSSDLADNSWKCSLEEFEQLNLEKNSMIIDLARCRESLESTKLQLVDVEHELAEVKSQLSSAQKSNSLSETQLKCMAESYKNLETRAEELQTEVNLLHGKLEGLRVELEEEKRSHQDALSRCRNLEEQLHRMESSQSAEVDSRSNQERELEAASERLAQCQETIFLLGKQLNSLRPPTEMTGTAYRERHKGEDFNEEASVSNMNLQDIDVAESDAPGSPTIQRTGGESPIDVYNVPYSSDSEGKNLYLRSPTSLKSPKHPQAFPASSSTSPIPDKHSRGLSRFFSSKSKNSF